MYLESQTKLNYFYDSLLFTLRYVLGCEGSPFFVKSVLEHVHVCCVDHFRREIVPSSVCSEIERVKLFTSHSIRRSVFHQLEIVLPARTGLLTEVR